MWMHLTFHNGRQLPKMKTFLVLTPPQSPPLISALFAKIVLNDFVTQRWFKLPSLLALLYVHHLSQKSFSRFSLSGDVYVVYYIVLTGTKVISSIEFDSRGEGEKNHCDPGKGGKGDNFHSLMAKC